MKFADVSFITDDVPRLQAFYEAVFGGKAEGNKRHASLAVDGMGFTFLEQKNPAFYYERTEGASNIIQLYSQEQDSTSDLLSQLTHQKSEAKRWEGNYNNLYRQHVQLKRSKGLAIE